jgi:hypothetical protein
MSAPFAPGRLGELRIVSRGDGWLVSTPGPPAGAPTDVREWARFDVSGNYRPLPGTRGLQGGLRVECRDDSELKATIDAIYPLATTHLSQIERGELRVVRLRDSLARQTGRYEAARSISPRGAEVAREALCGRCLKVPLWARDSLADVSEIPCPEACSVMIALCREVAIWEPDPPAPVAAEASIPFAAFETPGNEVREAVLADLEERLR